MASVTELVAVFAIVAFAFGAVFSGIVIVAREVKREDRAASKRKLVALHNDPARATTRGVRRMLTGAGSRSGN